MELNSIFQTYHGENETTINLMCINKKEECAGDKMIPTSWATVYV